MAKTSAVDRTDLYASIRAQLTSQIDALAIEQERLREVLRLMSAGSNGRAAAPLVPRPLVPDPVDEVIPTPKRRGWSKAAREAQGRRARAYWRDRKRKAR